jgi:hypothetical protein
MELADEWIGGKKTADTAFDLEDPLAEDSEGDEAGARSPASDG